MIKRFEINSRRVRDDRRGAMLVMIGVVFIILFISAAFAIDIARMHVTRSELRTATDAAAKAAVEALGREQSIAAGTDAAIAIAEQNMVAGNGLSLRPSDIEFGGAVAQADGSFQFDPDSSFTNAARVVGARTSSSLDGSVSLFFAPVFGAENFQPTQVATATRTDRDIALVLDVSGSMENFGRFAALENGLDVFLQELDSTSQQEMVSLTVYSTQARKIQALTSSTDQIRDAFADEHPLVYTAIGRGLKTGLDSIMNDPGARPFALKSIVVMTDGNQNRGVNPVAVARQCARQDVTVHTITFSEGANQTLMQEIATIANGEHLHADTNEQLVDAFREIARQLQVLLIE